MYYPDDDTLVIDQHAVEDTETDEDETVSQTSSGGKRYKGFCYGRLNPDLLLCKVFYFAFYGSYGAIYPLIAVYFKQLGLSATKSGILVGIRPFVEFGAAPMWGAVADNWRKAKLLLLFSLFSWLIFTEAVTFVEPAPQTCSQINVSVPFNSTVIIVYHEKHKLTVKDAPRNNVLKRYNQTGLTSRAVPLKINTTMLYGESHQTLIYKHESYDAEVQFTVLFLLMIVGEFFSSPTITLADSATLGYLGHNRMDMYGRQRMFGSLSWGLIMLVEGLILEHTKTVKVDCDGHVTEEIVNYRICFGTYAIMITCAFFVATQFQFKYRSPISNNRPTQLTDMSQLISEENVSGKTHRKYNGATRLKIKPLARRLPEVPGAKPNHFEALGMYASVRYGTVLFVVWSTGYGFGFLFTFLYWHLHDMGGPSTLFGVASIVNHLSEVMGYFFSDWFLRNVGHIPVLCLGLVCFAIRFLVISVLVNPWWVLAVESLQGLTHALVWAAGTSYIGEATPQRNRSSAQGILQGVYHGLGRGCGAIIGGLIINVYGSTTAFRYTGIAYIVIAIAFALVQYLKRGETGTIRHAMTEYRRPVADTSLAWDDNAIHTLGTESGTDPWLKRNNETTARWLKRDGGSTSTSEYHAGSESGSVDRDDS